MTIAREYDFDTIIDRRNTDSNKWVKFGEDKIPMWVAEMEFKTAPEILEALHERIEHGIFGYTMDSKELREVMVERMQRLYNWAIEPDWMVFNPGMVLTLNLITQTASNMGDGILLNSPVYGPFYNTAKIRRRFAVPADMTRVDDDANTFHYELDFDAIENAITDQTSLYFFCDPHNPSGKIFTQGDKERLAEICLKNNIMIVGDYIHADLLLDGREDFQPINTLSPEVEKNSVALFAPTKTFNIPGQACSIAIVPNPELREKMTTLASRSGYHVDTLAYTAAVAGYKYGGAWLYAVRDYLTENRDVMVDFIRNELPMLKTTVPDATYLAWIDCSALNIPDGMTLQEFFIQRGNVVCSSGDFFGKGTNHYIRLNFAAPRRMLIDALHGMKQAIETL